MLLPSAVKTILLLHTIRWPVPSNSKRFTSARLLYPLISRILRLIVTYKVVPKIPEIDRERPICYILESNAISNVLILQDVCRELQLPLPLDELPVTALDSMRSVVGIQNLKGFWVRRPDLREHLAPLSAMTRAVEEEQCSDIQLVPVSIFLGRSPDKEDSFWRLVFSENWAIAGRVRRLISLLIHGRATQVQFGRSISLAEVIDEGIGRPRAVRKLSRVLRVHFRRVRTAALGPDLSHRRTLVDDILRQPRVRDAVKAHAKKNNVTIGKARARAKSYAREIAADYSYPIVRVFSRILEWFWNRIYNGLQINHLDNFTQVTEGTEIIYVPCHRSHIDYLLASYLLFRHGFVVPHIAAGVNLNLPVVGPILRRGGAFFLRRSFRSSMLYSAVFHEYVETIFAKGVSMEYFIEGTRSRTGRLLQPRTGMVAMTVRSFLKHNERPTVFVPIYIGYERLVEGGAYLGELSGGAKKKETIGGLVRSFKILKEQFGEVSVSFGEPIHLAEHLDETAPEWRDEPIRDDAKPQWLGSSVDSLAWKILTNINEAAHVNAINLVALALLSSPKNALAEEDLHSQIALYQELITALPYSHLTTVTSDTPDKIVARAESMNVIERQSHDLGDILRCGERGAFLLSYFRNNALHLTAVYSWCACLFVNNVSIRRSELLRLGKVIYFFLQGELFLRYSSDEFVEECEKCLAHFERINLLIDSGEEDVLQRAHGGSAEALRLKMLGENVLASLERYYITIALLARCGSGQLSATELERLCHQTAQRLSMIYTLDTPEYFDKALFKHFIRRLKDRKVIDTDDAGNLTFGDILVNIVQEAKGVLGKEIRHSIIQVSPTRSAPEDKESKHSESPARSAEVAARNLEKAERDVTEAEQSAPVEESDSSASAQNQDER